MQISFHKNIGINKQTRTAKTIKTQTINIKSSSEALIKDLNAIRKNLNKVILDELINDTHSK